MGYLDGGETLTGIKVSNFQNVDSTGEKRVTLNFDYIIYITNQSKFQSNKHMLLYKTKNTFLGVFGFYLQQHQHTTQQHANFEYQSNISKFQSLYGVEPNLNFKVTSKFHQPSYTWILYIASVDFYTQSVDLYTWILYNCHKSQNLGRCR